jgi:hypothetical protein
VGGVESGSDLPGATGNVTHDVVLADGEVIEGLGANAYVQEGPLTTSLRAVPAEGADRFLQSAAG